MRALFLLLVASCASGTPTATATSTSTSTATSTSTSTATSTPTASATPTPDSSVRLLDHGAEPLRPLRYAWHADRKELMTAELRTTVSMVDADVHQDTQMPPLHVVIAIDPQSVTPDGDLRFAWRVVRASADQDAGSASPQVAEAWRQQIAPLEHLSGNAIVGPDGLSKGVTVDPESRAAPDAEMVAQVLQMLRDYVAPLPAEPVGKGARWQRVTTLRAKNGNATQTDTYTLTELHDDKGKLDDVVAQTASPQLLPSPGGPGSVPPPERVDSLLTSGTEKLAFDLGRIVSQAKFDGTTAMSLSSQSRALSMVMHVGITVSGEPR
jgi:hypothetical protein